MPAAGDAKIWIRLAVTWASALLQGSERTCLSLHMCIESSVQSCASRVLYSPDMTVTACAGVH